MASNIDVVVAYLDALAASPPALGDARALLSDDLEYHDALMDAATADQLIAALEQVGTGGAPIERLEIAENGDAVAVLTTFALAPGNLVHFTQWFWIAGGRITASRVIYDPRPFLEFAGGGSG